MFVGKFMHSYENNQLPSHFNQYFKSIQTVHKYPTRLACSKNFFLPGVTSSKGNAPSNSLDPRYGQKYLTTSSFYLTLISNICTKITYSLGLLVQINKTSLFKLILYCPFFVICRIFSLCLARYFILNRHCKASL